MVQDSSGETTTEEPFTIITSTPPVSTSTETKTTADISSPSTTITKIASSTSKPSTVYTTESTTSATHVNTDPPIDSKYSKCGM